MADKKESRNSLKSKFSANFRSGLKLPVLDPILNESIDDSTLVINPPASIPTANKNHHKNLTKFKSRSKLTPKWDGTTLVAAGSDSIIQRLKDEQKGRGDDNQVKVRDRVGSDEAIDEMLQMLKLSSPGQDEDSSFEAGDGDTYKDETILNSLQGKGGDNLETEINQRISSVYRSIENLEKKRVNFNNSSQAARRTVADGVKNKIIISKLSATASATTLDSDNNDESDIGRKSSKIIDVTRTYPKMFGLDPMKVIASSEDDSDVDENGLKDPRKKTKKSIRKYLEQLVQQEQPRDMSAIMPTLSEKTFLTKLQKRESLLNKEINDMRNNLDVMNMKAEREAKKAKVDRNKNKDKHFNKRLNVTKLMAPNPDKGPARLLTDFLQGTGGSSGGWKIEDHMTFLRGFRKWSSHPIKLVDKLCQVLSNKKPEEVVEHIAWQEKYEKLNNANRAHIRQWQLNRRKEREIVYQMASESQKARLENEKRHQDLVQFKRAEEREKNHHLLSAWKRSNARGRRIMKQGETGQVELDTSEKIAKMDLEMNHVRKEIRDITSMTKDIGKSLQNLDNETIGDQRKLKNGRYIKTASEASSGFCEMSLEEIETVTKELAGDGENFLRTSSTDQNRRNLSAKSSTSFYTNALHRDPSQVAQSKKMFQEFRNRDEEMMIAKKKAIMDKKEKMRNSTFLSNKQIKERMKKITVPSKLMCPTKGWMIRKEIRAQEKIESQNRDRSEGTLWSSESKDSFNSPSNINNILKLGTPDWRKTTASFN